MSKKRGKCVCSEHGTRREFGVKFCANCRKILKYKDHPYPADKPPPKKGKKNGRLSRSR